MSIKHYASIIVRKFPEICQSIENRITYILEIGIPDFLWRNMRDNRLPQTSPQETDMAMRGDWGSETLYIPILKGILIVYVADKFIRIPVSISSNCTLF